MISDKYRRVNTSDIDAQLRTALTQRGIYDENALTVRYLAQGGRGSRHAVRYTLHSLQTVAGGDTIIPTIYVFNSYQGECALRISVGFYRLVCSNGLVVGSAHFERRIVHRVGETCERQLRELYVALVAAVEYAASGQLATDIAELSATQLDRSKMLALVNRLGFSAQRTTQIKWRLANPTLFRVEDSAPTLWSLWNIVNEVLRHRSRNELRIATSNLGLIDTLKELAKEAA